MSRGWSSNTTKYLDALVLIQRAKSEGGTNREVGHQQAAPPRIGNRFQVDGSDGQSLPHTTSTSAESALDVSRATGAPESVGADFGGAEPESEHPCLDDVAGNSSPATSAPSQTKSEAPRERGPARETQPDKEAAVQILEPHAHWVEKGKSTNVTARNGRYGPIIKITHGDLELEGNSQVVRSWLNTLRSEVLDAIARAEREQAA